MSTSSGSWVTGSTFLRMFQKWGIKRPPTTTRKGLLAPYRCQPAVLPGIQVILLLVVSISAIPGNAATYPGFELLQESRCNTADTHLLSTLPKQWQQYAGFIKSCELVDKANTRSGFRLVSVWVDDYFQLKFPRQHPRWEPFPNALILDARLKVVGRLPVVYPRDDITSPDVFYGRWIAGLPTEIRVDVENPAEGGDYYYPPLVWNELSHTYQSSGTEAIDGRRPR